MNISIGEKKVFGGAAPRYKRFVTRDKSTLRTKWTSPETNKFPMTNKTNKSNPSLNMTFKI